MKDYILYVLSHQPSIGLSKIYVLIIVVLSHQRAIEDNRRKFRSQTSDNMQRWKSRGGKSQDGEVKK